jgi:hypothetical protein
MRLTTAIAASALALATSLTVAAAAIGGLAGKCT